MNTRKCDAVTLDHYRKQQKKIKYQNILLSFIGIGFFILIWECLVLFHVVDARHLSSPWETLKLFFIKFYDESPDGALLYINIYASLKVVLSGFFLAVAIGVPLGLFMGWYKGFDSFMRPVFEIIRPIPPISWIPLTIVWLGIGLRAKAFIVFFSAFVPCVINSYTGVKQAKPVLIDFCKTCGASNFTIFKKIGIPSASVMIFSGVKIALGNAWATLVAAEMLASSSGLGYMILMGRQFTRPDLIILGICVIGMIGVILTTLLEKVEGLVLTWR